MEPQPVVPLVPPAPTTPTPTKSKLPIIIFSLVVLLLVGGGGTFVGRWSATPLPTPTPVTIVPTEVPLPTSVVNNWPTANFSLTISFKLPTNVPEPKYVNAGHYAQETILPNGTYFQIWGADGASPTGGKDDYAKLKQSIETGISKSSTGPDIVDGHEALNFDPTVNMSDLVWGGATSTETHGVLVKMDDGRALVILHYQINNPNNDATKFIGDWENDSTVFDQILSTFKFTDSTQSQNILDIIKAQTNPMVWTDPQASSDTYTKTESQGPSNVSYPGKHIQSLFYSKESNKLAPFLGTFSADGGANGLINYGWKFTGGGDGVGFSTYHYELHSSASWQFMNINLKGVAASGEYKVFLSDPINN